MAKCLSMYSMLSRKCLVAINTSKIQHIHFPQLLKVSTHPLLPSHIHTSAQHIHKHTHTFNDMWHQICLDGLAGFTQTTLMSSAGAVIDNREFDYHPDWTGTHPHTQKQTRKRTYMPWVWQLHCSLLPPLSKEAVLHVLLHWVCVSHEVTLSVGKWGSGAVIHVIWAGLWFLTFGPQ